MKEQRDCVNRFKYQTMETLKVNMLALLFQFNRESFNAIEFFSQIFFLVLLWIGQRKTS